MIQEYVLASGNRGKLREMTALLQPLGLVVRPQSDWQVPEVEETASTFIENSLIKARHASRITGLPTIADDSGLVVEALAGAPGIHSARWAGPGRDFAMAMKKVEDDLKGADDRRAHFACALSLCWPDGQLETFRGEVQGRLVWPPRGGHGFGYDPMFVPRGHDATFGEMEPAAKHAISHRAVAFGKLAAACLDHD